MFLLKIEAIWAYNQYNYKEERLLEYILNNDFNYSKIYDTIYKNEEIFKDFCKSIKKIKIRKESTY